MTNPSNTAIRITELDFVSIKENLKNFLRSQSEFADFDFEGSGMSVLLDILAYNTHYMAYYLNMTANEIFLDTAQLRSSVLSHAKMINYVPKSKTASESVVNIKVNVEPGEENGATTLVLDKYTRLLGADIDGINYPFVTMTTNTAVRSANTFTFGNVVIKQGEVVTQQFLMDSNNEKRMFEIPSANVDTSTISVVVFESTTNSYSESYTQATDITEINSESRVFFIEENNSLRYTVQFGDDILGKKPRNGNVISITYLDTQGELANKINRFTMVDNIGAFSSNIIVTGVSSSFGGSDKESIDDVKFNAPYFYTTQNRAVINSDYETLILKDYPNIDSVSVWGGEDNDPIVYGKVFISMKPKGNFVLTTQEKLKIINDIIRTRSVVTVTPEIVDPDFVYVVIIGTVYYNPTLTDKTSGEIEVLVKSAISDYSDEELNGFNSIFKKSKLQNFIDGADESITGSEITVYVQKRVELETFVSRNYTLNYNYSIKKGDFISRIFSEPAVKALDSAGVERDVLFEEAPNADTGILAIDVLDGGRNYSSVPTVIVSGDGAGAKAQAVIRNGQVVGINILDAGVNYTRADVIISGGGGSGARARVLIQAKYGKLRSYYFKENGEREILNENAGDIDYENGVITINSFTSLGIPSNPFYDDNVLVVNAPIEREILSTVRNRILDIDEDVASSIQIQVVPDTEL